MRKRPEDLDRVFLVAFLALVIAGPVVIYSVCQGEDTGIPSDLWLTHARYAALGLLAFALCAAIPYAVLERLSPVLYLAGIGLLVWVLVDGSSAGGATRWLRIARVRFQPSEFAKLFTVLLLARVLAAQRRPADRFFSLMYLAAIVILPTALVLRQPDLGTTLVFLVIFPTMLYWSGVSFAYMLLAASPLLSVLCALNLYSWIAFTGFLLALAFFSRVLLLERIVFVSLSVVVGILAPVFQPRLHPYQLERLKAFLDPEKFGFGAGYQIIQSQVAFGTGGLTGLGYLEGVQKKLAFLPALHTDFIFSVVGEELGFLGTMTILALFTVLILRGFRIAAGAREPFAGLTVVGILSMLAFQVFVNIGVTVGLVPVTGLPLPILSYGGSSLVATMAGLGIVLGVGLRRRH